MVNKVVLRRITNTCFDIANMILKNSPNVIAEFIKLIRLVVNEVKKGII